MTEVNGRDSKREESQSQVLWEMVTSVSTGDLTERSGRREGSLPRTQQRVQGAWQPRNCKNGY